MLCSALTSLNGAANFSTFTVAFKNKIVAEEAIKSKSQIGGKKSGESRRKKAWRQHAEERAIEKIKEQPCLSNSALATEIAARWKEPHHKEPSHRTLEGYVEELRKNGKLPSKKARNEALRFGSEALRFVD